MAEARMHIIWDAKAPDDLTMFKLWAKRCKTVTVTPNRVQTRNFKRPTYSVCFFRAADTQRTPVALADAGRPRVEARNSLPSFVHFGPMCKAADLLTTHSLTSVAVKKGRGFTMPGHSRSDAVMAKRAEDMQTMLQQALDGLRVGAEDADEAGMLLWCAAATAVVHANKAVSDGALLTRVAQWAAHGTSAAVPPPSPTRDVGAGLVGASVGEVAAAYLAPPSPHIRAVSPLPTAPAQPSSPWDPFTSPSRPSAPTARQAEEDDEEEEEEAWNTIHRSNTALSGRQGRPSLSTAPTLTRHSSIRRSNSGRRALKAPPAGPKRAGLAPPPGPTPSSTVVLSALQESPGSPGTISTPPGVKVVGAVFDPFASPAGAGGGSGGSLFG